MSNRLEYLYTKNIQGSLTEEEYLEFCQLVVEDKNTADLEKLADQSWEDDDQSHIIPEDKAKTLFQNILTQGKAADEVKHITRSINWYKWAASAAALVCIALGSALYLHQNKTVKAQMAKAVSTNEHQLIKLADGSSVVLNKTSYLTYPVTFEGKTREVTLVGEGYFDIKHDMQHPFIVHTGKLVTTVLGTAFNIKAYNQDKNITVTVTRGKVSVSDEHKVLGVITPNEQIAFNKDARQTIQLNVNSDKIVEWQSKDLFLPNLNMEQAAVVLQQRFNVKITFSNDAVKKCRFTGTFLHGEKLKDILQVICDFNNATYKTNDEGHIIINGPGCP